MDKGLFTTTSENNGAVNRRRLLKIQDETGAINITIWNEKVNDSLIIKTVLYKDYSIYRLMNFQI